MGTKMNQVITKINKQTDCLSIVPDRKIRVFISSKCGIEEYDRVRSELKKKLEATKLIKAYCFETAGSSSYSAEKQFMSNLRFSDVCIFLIDNKDDVSEGVQKEVNAAMRYNKKSLFYFCDERKKDKTQLENSMVGSSFAKSKTVHSFSELGINGAQDLIDEIVSMYFFYCQGILTLQSDEVIESQKISITSSEMNKLPMIPKSTLKNIDKCKNYIMRIAFGQSINRLPNEKEKTSTLDEWGNEFLPILFEGKTIKSFNVEMYLEDIGEFQSKELSQVVRLRWKAIQSYFVDDIEKCLEYLVEALEQAQEKRLPEWFINDILIDIRNFQWDYDISAKQPIGFSAQNKLDESKEGLYYPILDRILDSLNEKYIEGAYKNKIQSIYTISFNNDSEQFSELLASSLIVSMYNGSLTHIYLIYERIRNCVFYLCGKYDDWVLRLNLLKLAIFETKEKEVEGIQNTYPETLNLMTSSDAVSVMKFCLNQPIKQRRFNSKLLAFGTVGLFLDDKTYKEYEEIIVEEVFAWSRSDNSGMTTGNCVLKALSGVAPRMSQDSLGDICCQFFKKQDYRWYRELFNFIIRNIDLEKMSSNKAQNLVDQITRTFENKSGLSALKDVSSVLYILRKQSLSMTEELDRKVKEYLPSFYEDLYKMETTKNIDQDMPIFIQKFIKDIKHNNENQGKEGIFLGHTINKIATIKNILSNNDILLDCKTMDNLIVTIADTLIVSKENVNTKLDAVALLNFIRFRFPEAYMRNQKTYEKIFELKNEIKTNWQLFSTNVSNISLKIGLLFLCVSMGKDMYGELLELLPLIQGDDATTISVTGFLIDYLKNIKDFVLPINIEAVILPYDLQWLQSEYLDTRWNATRILFALSRNPVNSGVVNNQLIKLIDSDCYYIKNLILRNLNKEKGITSDTKKYIFC